MIGKPDTSRRDNPIVTDISGPIRATAIRSRAFPYGAFPRSDLSHSGFPHSGTGAPALGRQLTAQQGPDPDKEGHADDEWGANRGKVLQHAVTLPALRRRRSGQLGPLRARGPGGTAATGWRATASVTVPRIRSARTQRCTRDRQIVPTVDKCGKYAKEHPMRREVTGKITHQSRSSIRVLPSVFGLTRSSSRNSATPSS
jgi:hypothetical protein